MNIIKNQLQKLKSFFEFHENVFAMVVFAFLIMIFFVPVIFQGETLTTSIFCGGVTNGGPYEYDGTRPPVFPVRDPGAFAWQDETLSHHSGDKIKSNLEVPLWNSNMGLGYPILGGIQEGIFFPLNYIVFLFSSQLAWDILFLVKIFLAGFLTYLFVRKIGLNKKPAFLSGIVFMFSGYMLEYINMAHLSTEVLIPLILLAAENFLIKKSTKSLIFYISAIALTIFPGMPEATFFAVLLGGFWFIFSALFMHREKTLKENIKILSFFVLINTTALLISAEYTG